MIHEAAGHAERVERQRGAGDAERPVISTIASRAKLCTCSIRLVGVPVSMIWNIAVALLALRREVAGAIARRLARRCGLARRRNPGFNATLKEVRG